MKFRIALLALALSACNQTAPKQTGGQADGEILPGSASDAMLPLDTVRSQPPLAPRVEGTAKPAAKAARPGAAAASTRAAPAAEAPAAEAAADPAAPEGE